MDELLEAIPDLKKRQQFLYARFPGRAVNEQTYDDRLNFWKRTLLDACRKGLLSNEQSTLSVSAVGIAERFEWNGLKPLGLGTVLHELTKSGDWVDINKFRYLDDSYISQSLSSLFNLLMSSATWARDTVFGASHDDDGAPSIPLHGQYVIRRLVEESSNRLLSEMKATCHYASDYITSKRSIEEMLHSFMPTTSADVELLIQFMQQQGQIIVSSHQLGTIVKIKKDKSQLPKLEESDIGVFVLKETAFNLSKQTELLQSQVNGCMDKAKQHISAKQKVQALFCLRRKRMLSELLEKRLSSYETLTKILEQIQGAETQIEILSAYKLGATSLKQILSHQNISPESVESTMDLVSDVLSASAEIDQVLQSGNDSIQAQTTLYSDEDFEKELDELFEAEKATHIFPNLPEVPSHPVSAGDSETVTQERVEAVLN
ncbi:Snf7-domain-containing protein [Cladochytrium replicatum]|nr:Snf7-domain-containing protein [Cladochytrium replicatum]